MQLLDRYASIMYKMVETPAAGGRLEKADPVGRRRDAVAATMVADASLSDLAGVLRISRRVAAHRLHSGLAAVGSRREGVN